MPRTIVHKAIENMQRPIVPPANYVNEVMRRYMKAQHMTSDSIGEKLNISGAGVRQQISKPAEKWKMSDLKKYSAVINIPMPELLEALSKSI